MLSEQCNFRCFYCYERFSNNKLNDLDQRIIKFIHKLVNDYDIHSIVMSFFGGEPMLYYDKIIKIMEYNNSIVNTYGDMTTNGYLLSIEKFEKLVKLNVREYQITFDGYKDYHDKFRVTVGKTPTFDRIFKNIISYKNVKSDFKVKIRIHIHKNNSSSVKKLIDLLADYLGNDKRYSILIRSISKLGGSNDEMISLPSREEVEDVLAYAKSKGLSIAMPIHNICYASLPNSIVIRSDGKISKCTVDLYSDRNIIGYLDSDGNLRLDQNKLRFWTRGFFTGDLKELRCPLTGEDNYD
ncbi:radical SAM protein [Saccharolobus islandicus]|uniref:Radical SAM domain protein n=2 Tax=Saccharolobus islandicus TaxID=43080 RepID=F0ND45_SACI5|nr:radical SAM protein [Sulfolobus islandicus]ADX86342.1 radical SAM domain protein [Sulfolobus islandicus REY15A]